MSVLRIIYFGLALWGGFHAMTAGSATLGLSGFMSQGFGALIPALALGVWALSETWVRRRWLALIALPVTLFLGLGCGLPLYLFLRTRPVRGARAKLKG